MELVVECRTGLMGESLPKKFYLGKRSLEVLEIMDQWHGSNHHYFKVTACDACVYILKRDTDLGFWELSVYREDTPALNQQTPRQSTPKVT